MSIESLLRRTCRPPEPPRTPGISPMPSPTTYHPYCHSPSALTEYLKAKLHAQCAKRLSCSLPAQVEQNVLLERNNNQLQFLVCWKGFSEAHDSWEPAKNIHADELMADFYKRHPLAIRSIPSPIIIHSINMSTTSLSKRIKDAPAPSGRMPV